VVTINIVVIIVDLDQSFVEHRLGANKELIGFRTATPHEGRSTVPLDRDHLICRHVVEEVYKTGTHAMENHVFGVLQVGVCRHTFLSDTCSIA
jgi:hypothetical protein